MWDLFLTKTDTYKLRQGTSLVIQRAKTALTVNSFHFRAAIALNHLADARSHWLSLNLVSNRIKYIVDANAVLSLILYLYFFLLYFYFWFVQTILILVFKLVYVTRM